MSVSDGQDADAATFNAAFASKSVDNTLSGVQTLSNAGSTTIADAQQQVNDNKDNIATNVSDIATNVSDIATNTGDISTNTSAIALNTAKVSADGSVTTHSDVGGSAPNNGEVLSYVSGNNQYEPLALSPTGDAWGDAVDADIVADVTDSRNFGSSTKFFDTSYINNMRSPRVQATDADNSDLNHVEMTGIAQSAPDTTSYETSIRTIRDSDKLGIWTRNSSLQPSAGVTVQSGNTTATTQDSGDIKVKTGTATKDSGDIILETGTATTTRGAVTIIDGSEGTAGHVFTSQGTGGEGAWQAPGAASTELTVTTKATTYTILTSDEVILCSGSAFTLTLPTAVGNTGKFYIIKKTSNDFNIYTIEGDGSETIDGDLNKTLNTVNESYELYSDNSNWHVRSHKTDTKVTSFTPTYNGLGTPTLGFANWTRKGKLMYLNYQITTGTVTAAEMQISLPSTYTIDNSSGTQAVRVAGGTGHGASNAQINVMATDGDNYFNFSTAQNTTPLTANLVVVSSVIFSFSAVVAIAEWSD